MSKLARTLILGAALAAMNLAGTTTVAQAQTSDEPAGKQDARRPPTERQVGESYRNYHEALAAQAQTAQADAVERFRRGERAPQEQPTIADDTRRPKRKWASPGATPRTSRCSRPNRAGSLAGSSSDLGCWPLPWRWPAGWP